jgi:hypothetical protein
MWMTSPQKDAAIHNFGARERILRMPLTIPELRTAASFLRQAKTLVESALDYFRGEDPTRSAKLGEISRRLSDEGGAIDRLIAKAPSGGAKNG